MNLRLRSDRSGYFCFLALALFTVSISPVLASDGKCKLGTMAEFPITMVGLRPLMTAKINDVDVQFAVDSGAFYSMISAASAAELKLKTFPVPPGFYVSGFGGGRAKVSLATVKVFTIAGAPVPNVEFLVGGSEVGAGSVGTLGQNVLHIGDVEYDLGQGVVRLMKPQDCSKALLAYWVSTSTPYSVISTASEAPLYTSSTGSLIARKTPQLSQTGSSAYVNGAEIRVWFDTGSPLSYLSLKAAAKAGIKPDSPGVTVAGRTGGIGRTTVPTYIAPVSSFKIGEEEIRNTRLRIADIDLQNVDMLIGADFFLSHRIYVANSQHRLYFTYNGGPVFNLANTQHPKTGTEPVAGASSGEPQASGDPGDAADYSRRGAAFASRREFDQALPALARACELAPDSAEYLYQRGMVYWQIKQTASAMADFDQALKLKPDDLPVLVSRAQLLLESGDKLRAGADLDAADAAASKEADTRLVMGEIYAAADLLESAIAQYDLWIAAHPDDARVPSALNSRCWVRGLRGVDLARALKDCNAALRRADKSDPFYAAVADSRGLVLLRMGDYDKSIADYDASLKIKPQNAWSLYGRGIDELRKRKTSDGEADMARAAAIWPQVADEFKRRGIVP